MIYCVECGARLRRYCGRWVPLMSLAPCVSASGDHLPDPLDLALRRVRDAEEAVKHAKAALQEARESYDYLKAVRVKR